MITGAHEICALLYINTQIPYFTHPWKERYLWMYYNALFIQKPLSKQHSDIENFNQKHFNKCSAVAQMGDRLATINMGRKVGAVLLLGELGPPSNTVSLGPRRTSLRSGILIHPAVWRQQTWAENGGTVPLWGTGAGSHLTQCGQCRGLLPRHVLS